MNQFLPPPGDLLGSNSKRMTGKSEKKWDRMEGENDEAEGKETHD